MSDACLAATRAFGPLVGTWKQKSAENLEEQLKAQGFGWLMRKTLTRTKATLSFSLLGTTFQTTARVIGMDLPSTEAVIGATEACSVEALGRTSETWLSIEEGRPAALSKTFVTKATMQAGAPTFTCKVSYRLSSTNTLLTVETATQVHGRPDVVSRIEYERSVVVDAAIGTGPSLPATDL